ncbi:hypothetical protein D3C78_1184350 [compost metagenome]
MRKPVANIINPPTAEKSACIAGVVSGKMNTAPNASANWMTNCGTAISATARPSVEAKISAVNRSRKDLAISTLASPVIPSCIEPKMPVPLAQNSTIMATYASRNSFWSSLTAPLGAIRLRAQPPMRLMPRSM